MIQTFRISRICKRKAMPDPPIAAANGHAKCQLKPMITPKVLFVSCAAMAIASAQQGNPKFPPVPAGLLNDPHVREELVINDFTAPSIASIFESLEALAPLPVADFQRKIPERMPLDRADLAVELGFLIADGFLIVQAGELRKVRDLAAQLTRYGKALGGGGRVNRHAASLLQCAREGHVDQLKVELSATQRDVELELVTLRDADLAHLISLGGWIRALEVASGAVEKQFSEDRARKIMREDIADYYASVISALEPRIAERPNYVLLHDQLAAMQTAMTVPEGQGPTKEQVREVRKQAARLVELALRRDERP